MGIGVNVHAELICYYSEKLNNAFGFKTKIYCICRNRTVGLKFDICEATIFIIRGTIVMPGFLAKKKKVLCDI